MFADAKASQNPEMMNYTLSMIIVTKMQAFSRILILKI